MRGKRELPRKRNPLLMLCDVFLAAGMILAVCMVLLRPSLPAPDAPAGPEAPPSSPEYKEALPAQPVSGPASGPGAAGQPDKPEEAPEPQTSFVISLLGDCTLSSSHYTNHFESFVGDDLEYPFSNVAEILNADDLTLANLECSFSEKKLESASEYAFCGQPKYAQSLALGGVDCVSMGNNHTNDFGEAGVADTAAALEQEGITGIQENQGVCFDLRHGDGTSLRVGIFVLRFNGSAEQMKNGAARLREEGADIVIACMHAGAEKIYVPTKRQRALAHAAISGGADLVVGTHPHVLQPVESYQGGVILYSIGNFCFGGNRNPTDKDTVIAQLAVQVEQDGVSWSMAYIPCSVSSVANKNDYRPTPYAQDASGYQRCLRKLAEPWDKTTAEEAAAKAAEAAEAASPTDAGQEAVGEEPVEESSGIPEGE